MFGDFPLLQRFHEGKAGVEAFDEADMVLIGTPDDVIRKMEAYERIGVDHVLCDVDFGHLKHEDIMRSIELSGEIRHPVLQEEGHPGGCRLRGPSGGGGRWSPIATG